MKTTAHASLLALAFALGGCASTSAAPQAPVAPLASAAPRTTGAAVAAGEALRCMVEVAPSPRCQSLAAAAGVSASALANAEPAVIEQFSESLAAQSRAERLPMLARSTLLRWFDFAAGATREAMRAHAGTEGRRLNAPSTSESFEDALRGDVTDARATARLAALFDLVATAGEFAPEVEASALMLLAHRARSVQTAQPEVRTEAARALTELVERVGRTPGATASANGEGERARGARSQDRTDSAVAVEAARELLTRRLTALGNAGEASPLRQAAAEGLVRLQDAAE
jgi:hypothetical protein